MQLRTNYPTRALGHSVDHQAIKVRAFIDHGIVVADVNDPSLDPFERQFLKNIGAKLVGQRAA